MWPIVQMGHSEFQTVDAKRNIEIVNAASVAALEETVLARVVTVEAAKKQQKSLTQQDWLCAECRVLKVRHWGRAQASSTCHCMVVTLLVLKEHEYPLGIFSFLYVLSQLSLGELFLGTTLSLLMYRFQLQRDRLPCLMWTSSLPAFHTCSGYFHLVWFKRNSNSPSPQRQSIYEKRAEAGL